MPDIKSDRPKGRSLKPLKALWPFLRPYRGTLALALVALLVAAGALLTLPVALRHLIDTGFATADASAIDRQFLGLLAVAVVFALFAAVRFYLVTWLGERVVADMRTAVYRHVIGMDPAFFEVTQTGEVLSRLTTDTTLNSVDRRRGALHHAALHAQPGGRPDHARHHEREAHGHDRHAPAHGHHPSARRRPVGSAPAPRQPGSRRRCERAGRRDAQRDSDRSGVRAGGAPDRALRRVGRTRLSHGGAPHPRPCAADGGVHPVLLRRHRPGAVDRRPVRAGRRHERLAARAVLVLRPARGGRGGCAQRDVGRSAARGGRHGANGRAPAIAGAHSHAGASQDARSRGPRRHRVSGRVLQLSVTAEALADFDLQVRAGETVALVGPSGASKSTTFQLLLRFFDPSAGRILIDGVDIAEAAPRAVRGRVGLVPQDTVIFGTTALENIRYGRPGASDAEVQAAARAAVAAEFIEALPEGYDTFLGERGVRLSGGQRQRIAIARAILKNPPILLLDEATSSLDAENERLVQEALERLMEDRTTIIIAHRLATVLKADRIVVMDGGRIVDIGTHAELIGRDPLYARLAELQFGVDTELRSATPGAVRA